MTSSCEATLNHHTIIIFFFQSLEAAGLKVTYEDVPQTDHFNIIEQLVDENYHLTQVKVATQSKSM